MARCPTNDQHGAVIPLETQDHRYGWHCPNQDHDGRPKSHPAGAAPQTRAFFTTDEITAASKKGLTK